VNNRTGDLQNTRHYREQMHCLIKSFTSKQSRPALSKISYVPLWNRVFSSSDYTSYFSEWRKILATLRSKIAFSEIYRISCIN
jgi:hypothetical protein